MRVLAYVRQLGRIREPVGVSATSALGLPVSYTPFWRRRMPPGPYVPVGHSFECRHVALHP